MIDREKIAAAFQNYAVSSGVPIPKVSRSDVGRSKYPFAKMEIGDSFFVIGSGHARASAWHYAKISGKKFTCRKVIESGFVGTRTWRVG